MISEYFTIPLQGKVFNLFCDIIMGYKHIGDNLADIEYTVKECVGNKNKVTENSNLKNKDKLTI